MVSLIELKDSFVNLIFPNLCVSCKSVLVRGEEWLCTECLTDIPYANSPQDLITLQLKFAGRIPIEKVAAYMKFSKKGRVQDIMHAIKYNNNPDLGTTIGRWFGSKMKDSWSDIDRIVPVPLHFRKLKRRGFNQSECISHGVGEALLIESSPDCLIRLKDNPTQTKMTRSERWENVKDVFALNSRFNIEGEHILLVDDIITTGATLEACANTLLQGRALKVSIAVLALAQ